MTWIESISSGIEKAFSAVRPALKFIPPILLLCELKSRPGLSAIALTSAIIRRLPEAGIETGTNNDGSANKINQFVRIMCEETIKEIKENARVTTVVEPGSIVAFGTGAGPTGPVTVTTTNTIVSQVLGLIE